VGESAGDPGAKRPHRRRPGAESIRVHAQGVDPLRELRLSKTLLGRFFEKLGIRFEDVDWNGLSERDIQPILGVLHGLSNAQMVPIESELRTVYEMACDPGINALVETASAFGDHTLVSRMPEGQTAYGQSMWVWLEHPEYFAQAGLVFRRGGDDRRQPPPLGQRRRALGQCGQQP
jgi:hypothetical protein